MPKSVQKSLVSKEDMEITIPNGIFQRYAEKFEAQCSKAMLAFVNGREGSRTFQDYVAGGGVTIWMR